MHFWEFEEAIVGIAHHVPFWIRSSVIYNSKQFESTYMSNSRGYLNKLQYIRGWNAVTLLHIILCNTFWGRNVYIVGMKKMELQNNKYSIISNT